MSVQLLEAVHRLRVADPELGLKPLLTKLREQQGAATTEVREATADAEVRTAAQSLLRPAYTKLLAEGSWCASQEDWRRAARSCREAIPRKILYRNRTTGFNHETELGGTLIKQRFNGARKVVSTQLKTSRACVVENSPPAPSSVLYIYITHMITQWRHLHLPQ